MSKSIIKPFVSLIFFLILSFSVYSIDWSNFQVFSGSTAPYASNGPGCKLMGMGSGQTYTIGQGCPGNSLAYDLGAVWADLDSNYIAWMIYSPDMTDAGFCGGTKNSANIFEDPNALGITVEFDSDSNMNTGCRMPNMNSSTSDMCFPGSEYRFYVWGDNTTSFEMYNRSLPSCANSTLGMNATCFQAMNATLNPLYNITYNVTCNTPTIVKVAINRSAIANLTGMAFQTNTLGGQVMGPVDMLGGFDSSTGGFLSNFQLGGKKDFMSYTQHPCMQYDNTNQTICTTNPNNITGADGCGWDNFASRCNPNFDFRSQSCSEFCGACNTTSACLSGANGKCMVVAAPPQLPPDAITFDNSGTASFVLTISQK